MNKQLHALGAEQLVQQAQASSLKAETEYSTRHLLVRNMVAPGQIPPGRRGLRKRRAAAAWIEEGLPRPDDYAETLAHHYGEALELQRAIGGETEELVARTRDALRAAGDRAYSLGSVKTAREHYRSAMELWPARRAPTGPGSWSATGAGASWRITRPSSWLEPATLSWRPGTPHTLPRPSCTCSGTRGTRAGRGADEAATSISWNWPTSSSHRTRRRTCSQASRSSLMLSSQLDRARETATRSLQIAEHLAGFDDIRAHALNTMNGMCRAARGDRARSRPARAKPGSLRRAEKRGEHHPRLQESWLVPLQLRRPRRPG